MEHLLEDLPPWYAVEHRHEEVGDGEVEEEVVGDVPHGAVRQDDPQDDCVAQDCNHNYDREQESPDDLLQSPRILLKTPLNDLSTLKILNLNFHIKKIRRIIKEKNIKTSRFFPE